MNKKGIYFTLDVIIAIIIATSFTLVFFFMLSEVRTVVPEPLYQFSIDLSRALDVGGHFGNAIRDGNSSTIPLFFTGALRSSVCAKVDLYDDVPALLQSIDADNCAGQTPRSSSSVERIFEVDGGMYFARLTTWFKSEV